MVIVRPALLAPLTLHGSASGKRRGGSGTSKPPALSTPRAETFLEPKTLSHRESVFFSWTVHCAAVGGSAAYGCGIPLAGAARSLFGAPNGAPAGTQAKRFLWGEEEQRSVRSFRRKAETESSGLCDDDNGGADSLRRVGANPPRRGWHNIQTNSPYSAQVLLPVIRTSANRPIRVSGPLIRTSRLPSVREARG